MWSGELDGTVCFQNTLLRLRPRASANGHFLAWWCRHAFADGLFASISTGANIFHLSADRVRSLPMAYLPLPRQRAIANFLDAETARIDALIAKKVRMIELLSARTVAATDRRVLGIDSQPPVPSRTGFFESVPLNWAETTMRHLSCQVQTGPFGSQLHADEYVSDGWPVVNPASLQGGAIVPIASMAISAEKRTELARHILLPGDIVFGRRGEMGRAGLVTEREAGWLCGTGSLRLRLSPGSMLVPEYLKMLLETTALRRYFQLASVGSTMDNLNSDIILGMPCTLPSRAEQIEIVRDVEQRRAEAGRLTQRLSSQIDLLREHRQALITAAVTGELEVPGVAA